MGVGACPNGWRDWRLEGEPERMHVADFSLNVLGQIRPYGICDQGQNTNRVKVGSAQRSRWNACDAGGSNRILVPNACSSQRMVARTMGCACVCENGKSSKWPRRWVCAPASTTFLREPAQGATSSVARLRGTRAQWRDKPLVRSAVLLTHDRSRTDRATSIPRRIWLLCPFFREDGTLPSSPYRFDVLFILRTDNSLLL